MQRSMYHISFNVDRNQYSYRLLEMVTEEYDAMTDRTDSSNNVTCALDIVLAASETLILGEHKSATANNVGKRLRNSPIIMQAF